MDTALESVTVTGSVLVLDVVGPIPLEKNVNKPRHVYQLMK